MTASVESTLDLASITLDDLSSESWHKAVNSDGVDPDVLSPSGCTACSCCVTMCNQD